MSDLLLNDLRKLIVDAFERKATVVDLVSLCDFYLTQRPKSPFIIKIRKLLKSGVLFQEPMSVDYYFDREKRATYYLGSWKSWGDPKQIQDVTEDFYRVDKIMRYRYQQYRNNPKVGGSYRADMDFFIDATSSHDHEYLVQFGDRQVFSDFPVFVKTRRIASPTGILMKFNSARHWNLANLVVDDQPWKKKRSDPVWRGAPTGYSDRDRSALRRKLVRDYFQQYDIGFSHLGVQAIASDSAYLRGKLERADLLGYKYILAPEGNDVSTALKWILLSNSVPIMPEPTFESWLLESQLRPYLHYVPVAADYSNLPDIIEWCRKNDEHCYQIALNGKRYMQMFIDPKEEVETMLTLSHAYLRAMTEVYG